MTSVTLCIPAYQSEDTVARAIESALGQTHDNTRVLVSVDQSTDGTAEVCKRYADAPNLTLKVQDRRLGWAGNVNYCLDQVETDTVAMVFHDDWVEPEFASVLTGVLENDPSAVVAGCAIMHFGDLTRTRFSMEATGSLYERFLTFATQPEARHSLKSLHRMEAFRHGLRLDHKDMLGFQVDVPFSLEVLQRGGFRAVDEVLYHKRIEGESVSASWRDLSSEEYLSSFLEIRAQLIEIVAWSELEDTEKTAVTAAILSSVNRELVPAADVQDAAAWHARTAAAIAVRLAGGAIASAPLPDDVLIYRAQQLRTRAELLGKSGHTELANAEIMYARSLEGASGGPEQAIQLAREFLEAPRTPERLNAACRAAARAVRLAPARVPARIALAKALAAAGEEEAAAEAAKRAEMLRGERIRALDPILGRAS